MGIHWHTDKVLFEKNFYEGGFEQRLQAKYSNDGWVKKLKNPYRVIEKEVL